MNKTQLNSLVKEVLQEQSLEDNNKNLLKHLGMAEALAARSYKISKHNPDNAKPMFGTEIAEALKRIYNALSTGDGNDDTYQDEVFK